MADERATIIGATLVKFSEIASEFRRNEAEIARLRKRQEDLHAEAGKCYSVASLFNFDLTVELATGGSLQKEMFQTQLPREAKIPVLTGHKRIRDILYELLQAAYPHSMRAKALQSELEKRGLTPHEKTVGMTLYRMSKPTDGSVRREGKADWYFVPEDQRQQVPERETPDHESADDTFA